MTMTPQILVIDDDPSVTASFAELLRSRGYAVCTASRADEALKTQDMTALQLVVTDVCLPGMNGLDALMHFRERFPRLPVIVMTGQGSVDTAIEATKRGAFDYLLKPIEPDSLLKVVEKAVEGSRLMQSEVVLGASPVSAAAEGMVGQGPAMQAVYKAIGRVAPTDATVLIRGETGTGKELVARAMYQHSRRNQAPLIIVNCAAIPAPLLESELFGHERGAFSGALTRRIGRFEQADGGTIFLDEVGELPLDLQAKLLRILQEGSFDRVGGTSIRVDVRILSATNRDLETLLRENRFREDLFHRLNVVTIRLPSLRERIEDIPAIVEYFVARYAAELHRESVSLTPDAVAVLAEQTWPGNIRELQHFIQRLLIFCRHDVISAADVAAAVNEERTATTADGNWRTALAGLVNDYLSHNRGERSYDQFLTEVDRLILTDALQRTGNNQTLAAKFLGLTRSTLQSKLARLGLRGPKNDATE